MMVFNCMVHRNLSGFADRWLAHESRRPLLIHLVRGYGVRGIELACGSMLRECIQHEVLARALLEAEAVPLLLADFVRSPDFDVASDAFATLRALLTQHKALVADYLNPETGHYEAVFGRYNTLLQSHDYVVKRQALKVRSLAASHSARAGAGKSVRGKL